MDRRTACQSLCLVGAALLTQNGGGAALAQSPPRLQLRIGVAARRAKGGIREEVVTREFLEGEVAAANRIFEAAGVQFEHAADTQTFEESALETRADRDGLARLVTTPAIHVLVVDTLRDVDDPRLYRMGVTWAKLSKTSVKYVILAASARETTLAHELGHFLGCGHTSQRNNLMSYDRTDQDSFLTPTQGAIVRSAAARLRIAQERKAP